MNFFDAETWKVKSAAMIGLAAPGVNLFLRNLEPVLNTLILAGQIGVSAVTIIYIYKKWKHIPKRRTRNKKKEIKTP